MLELESKDVVLFPVLTIDLHQVTNPLHLIFSIFKMSEMVFFKILVGYEENSAWKEN